jgi:hypothetical protein
LSFGVAISLIIILYIKYLFIYYINKTKLVNGLLARDETPLNNYSALLSPIFSLL